MPRHREDFEITASLDGAIQAVSAALGELRSAGWQRLGSTNARLQCEEATDLLSFHNSARLDVTLVASGSGVRVGIDGVNTGFGPIQSRHVTHVVRGLRDRIELEATRLADPPAAQPPQSEEQEAAESITRSGKERVFVSYRRDDSGHVTDRICDRLAMAIGKEAIFKDIDNIPLGVNFREFLQDRVEKCDVLLAVIGGEWLGPDAEEGKTRLLNPSDLVRIELEAALARDIPVIPLLIRGASIPGAEMLPESLHELPYMNGIEIRRGHDFDNDMRRLIKQLERLLGELG